MSEDRTPRNLSATSIEGTVLAGATAVKLVDLNVNRIALWVSNLSAKSVVVRFNTAASSNDFEGILVPRGTSLKVIGGLDVYTGEVSVVGDGVNLLTSFTEI